MTTSENHTLPIGSVVPDFTLPGTSAEPVTLSTIATPTVLVFFPFAFSGICTGELCELRDNLAIFTRAGIRLLGISTDPAFTLKQFKSTEGYEFDLLSDFWPHGEVSRAYGVFDEKGGHAIRGSFLVDADRVLRWAVVNPASQARSLTGYEDAIAAL
ncbi:MAG TPA: peroxiredoxin [Pseudoclavibacter sp.]|nr:peroxiredoxin [Pseudoclavibacter sp.]